MRAQPIRYLSRQEVAGQFRDRSVAIVGSGPGALGNRPSFIDSHDVVVRVNNYKLHTETGFRTDVFYSFFGNSIRKKSADLMADGVGLCMCKCPNAQFMDSDWHRRMGKMSGVDFRWIYERRADWWFCDTYIPEVAEFMAHFHLLDGHVPTTGFAAILDVLSVEPKSVYLTGFDFFQSGLHNVDESWAPGDPADPIGHVPAGELKWLTENICKYPITTDDALKEAIKNPRAIRLQRYAVPKPVKRGWSIPVYNRNRGTVLQRTGNRHRVREVAVSGGETVRPGKRSGRYDPAE